MTSPTITSPYSLSEDMDINQYLSTSGDDIEKVTPVPDNKVPENNDTPNEPSTSQLQQNTKQTQTVKDNSDFDMSDYVKTHRFQEKLKSVKTKLTKEFSDTIAQYPEHIRNLILQILSTYPDILDIHKLILFIKMIIHNRWNQILMIALFKSYSTSRKNGPG